MTKASFDEAKAPIVARHQIALAEATAAFNQTTSDERDHYHLAAELAEHRWQQVKSNAGHPDHDRHRDAHESYKAPPSHRAAHDELDRAVRAADARLHTELRNLAAKHGITIYVGSTQQE